MGRKVSTRNNNAVSQWYQNFTLGHPVFEIVLNKICYQLLNTEFYSHFWWRRVEEILRKSLLKRQCKTRCRRIFLRIKKQEKERTIKKNIQNIIWKKNPRTSRRTFLKKKVESKTWLKNRGAFMLKTKHRTKNRKQGAGECFNVS